MLAKIVLGDESSSVRQAALARIKDQQILIMIALRSKDWDIRGRAATEIFVRTGDRTILAKEAIKVAVEDRDSEARLHAISFVDDQAALTKLAFSNTDLNVRVAALQHLDFKHRASMRRIAMQDSDWRFRLAVFKSEDDRFNKVILLNRLLDSDSVLANIAGHRDAIQCIADMKTITQHPTIRSRFPHLRCVASATKVSQNYGQIGSSPKSWETVNGERITVQYEQNGYILSAASWESRFPYMNDHPGDIKAEVVEGDLLRRFFHLRAFTSRDLAELAHADNVEVQMAAVRNINDRAFIAKFAIEEKDPDVREAAERRANELRRTR